MYLLYGCLALLNVGFHVKAENGTLKKNNFVDVLKQDLRRNNDDYAEMETNKLSSNKTTSLTTASRDFSNQMEERGVENNITGNNRRAGRARSLEFNYYDVKTGSSKVDKNIGKPSSQKNKLQPVTKEQWKRIMKKLPKNHIQPPIHVKRNISRLNVQPNIPKEIEVKLVKSSVIPITKRKPALNKKKVDKFKKFMMKNKHLFKEFFSSKLERPTIKFMKEEKVLRKKEKEHLTDKDDDDLLPNPNVLDLAPAKGGRVHRLRVKGRLCQRHVLMPEGPKYDSNGRWYVPEHRLVALRPYNVTPNPRFLLPRCCNCCKKSVLGCE